MKKNRKRQPTAFFSGVSQLELNKGTRTFMADEIPTPAQTPPTQTPTVTPEPVVPAAAQADEQDEAPTPQIKRSWWHRTTTNALHKTMRFACRHILGTRISGTENFKGLEGKPTLIIANHVSFADGLFLGAALPLDAAFAIDTGIHKKIMNHWMVKYNPLVKFVLNRIDFHPMDTTKPQAIRELTKLAKAGKPVMIFPEGRLTATGTLMQVFGGSAIVASKAKANIVPVYTDGLNFLDFGTTRLKNYPKRLIPKTSVTVLPPVKIDIPEGLTGKQRRKEADKQLEKIVQEMPVHAVDPKQSLIDALHDAAYNFGHKYDIIDDPEGEPLKYGKLLIGAYALGDKIAKLTTKGENVGFLLPNSKGAAVTFWGMQAYGRVPTMLNAKAEKTDMVSYTQTASLKTIVTSRRFVQMAKLEEKIAALSEKTKIVYLEDIKPQIGIFSKIKALLHAKDLLPRPKDAPKGGDPACIIFTSGSEGPPKGVVLSSTNLLSNAAQVHAITPLTPSDKAFNCMPIFHSFGLAGGMILPNLKGIRSFQYPNPLDGKNIPKLVYFYDTTIMFGTDTFLNLYARNATDKDFGSLRMVFAGAERLQDETYEMYVDRFNVRVNNTYGLSEAAPAVAMNVPGAHKRGTVGKVLPGIETRLEPVPDMPDSYHLYIKGPNVMLGYLKYDNPGVLQPPKDGWHDTGDIVSMTKEGFMKLTGRAKRFAKIGGEMVSLDSVEEIAEAASKNPEAAHATVLRQDAGGDSIVMFTTDPAIKRNVMAKAAQETGRSILGLPKDADIHVIPAMPLLPTGKTDYVSLKKTLAQMEATANDNKKPAGAMAAEFTKAANDDSVAPANEPKPAAPEQKPPAPKAPGM
jgi:acyl-[acyl-carrier-protein]-phospholipid O-acyltransferase/long-chain-fatty-acid--[acyl-carrier-protein] ligase